MNEDAHPPWVIHQKGRKSNKVSPALVHQNFRRNWTAVRYTFTGSVAWTKLLPKLRDPSHVVYQKTCCCLHYLSCSFYRVERICYGLQMFIKFSRALQNVLLPVFHIDWVKRSPCIDRLVIFFNRLQDHAIQRKLHRRKRVPLVPNKNFACDTTAMHRRY